MTELEDLKQLHDLLPTSHFKASINLGWKKLNKYYTLSDQAPAYRAAIVIHPAKKMKFFKVKWQTTHPEWIPDTKAAITTLYNEYKRRHADEAIIPAQPTKELTKFERYSLLEDDYDTMDDLERYLREERAPKDTNPLTWWIDNHHRYPILRHMAFDLLSTPASSSADERTFSQAKQSINDERFNTLDDLAESNQCAKSWISEGLIYKISAEKGKKNKRRRSGDSTSESDQEQPL
jgi:hypothetical protein